MGRFWKGITGGWGEWMRGEGVKGQGGVGGGWRGGRVV